MKHIIFTTLFYILSLPAAVYAQYGNGSAGNLTVSGTVIPNSVATRLISPNTITKTLTVTSTTGFVAGDVVLIMQMTGTGAGDWEYRTISIVNNSHHTYLKCISNQSLQYSWCCSDHQSTPIQ